jgi:hypothetical protein
MSEIINTTNAIIALADMIRRNAPLTSLTRINPRNHLEGVRDVTFEVYLPDEIDHATGYYAQYLIDHPRDGITLKFTQEDLGS